MAERKLEGGNWEDLKALVRSYARRRFGDECLGIVLELQHSGPARLPFGPVLHRSDDADELADGSSGQAASTSDYQRFCWPGLPIYRFNQEQGRVVERLLRAWQDNVPGVDQSVLLKYAGAKAHRLAELFAGHGAWGMLIQSTGPGKYRLADPVQSQQGS